MKEFCSLISNLFLFFSDTLVSLLINKDQSFQKPKGGLFDEKNLKKNGF